MGTLGALRDASTALPSPAVRDLDALDVAVGTKVVPRRSGSMRDSNRRDPGTPDAAIWSGFRGTDLNRQLGSLPDHGRRLRRPHRPYGRRAHGRILPASPRGMRFGGWV